MDQRFRDAVVKELREMAPELEDLVPILDEVAAMRDRDSAILPRVAVRNSKEFVRRYFNVELGDYVSAHETVFFDATTPVLKAFLERRVQGGMRVLEIGTGHVAINSIFLAKRFGPRIELAAVEIDPRFAASAREIMARNGVSFPLLVSDMLSNPAVGREFDLIFFNPPYVPSGKVPFYGIRETADGGEDGLKTVRRALAALPAALAPGGVLALALNTFYHSEAALAALLSDEFQGLSILECFRHEPGTGAVFVIGKQR